MSQEDGAGPVEVVPPEVAAVADVVASLGEADSPVPAVSESITEAVAAPVEEIAAAPVVVDASVAVEEPVVVEAPPEIVVVVEAPPEITVVVEAPPEVPAVVETPPEIPAAVEIPAVVEEVPVPETPVLVEVPVTEVIAAPEKMPPPKFEDLAKEANGLLNNNFHFGVINLESNTTAKNGTGVSLDCSHDTDSKSVLSGIATKFTYEKYGLTFLERWDTDSIVTSTTSLDGSATNGLEIDLDTSYAPATGEKSASLKSAFTGFENFHPTLGVDYDFSALTLHGSAVFRYKGMHAGYQASYDTANSKISANNCSLTYRDGDLVLHSKITDATKYTGSIHHQVTPNLAAAASLQWAQGTSTTLLTAVGKYDFDDRTFMKAKIDSNLQLGLSYVHKLRPSLSVTLCSLINAKSLEQGGHKLGLSLNFDA